MDWLNQKLLADVGVDLSALEDREEIAAFTIPGGKPAVDLWMKLSAAAGTLGGWPLLGGDAEDNRRQWEDLASDRERRETILREIPHGPPIAAMAEEKRLQRERMMAHLKQFGPPSLLDALAASAEPEAPVAPPDFSTWPIEPPSQAGRLPFGAFDHKRKPLTECSLLIVKTTTPADTPAYLSFGGFNDCPSPGVHVAFLRDWNRRYGVVPIVITHDVIELYLARPIVARDEAYKVALEQYQYAPDIVDQGTQNVEQLAREIWGSPFWFFWWD